MIEYDFNADGVVLGWETVFATAVAMAIALTALFIFGKLLVASLRPVVRFFKRLDQFTRDWAGSEADEALGIEHRDGVMVRLHNLEVGTVEIKSSLSAVTTEQASAAALFRAGTEHMADLQTQIDQIQLKVNTELSDNHGSSTRDASVKALEIVRAVAEQQEDFILQYAKDRAQDREHMLEGLILIRAAATMPEEDQESAWALFTAKVRGSEG